MAYELKGKPRKYFKWVEGVDDKPVGTTFRGIFIENGKDRYKAPGATEEKDTFHAIFEDENGERVQLSCPSVLVSLLAEAEKGMDLTITFIGYLPKKKAGQSAAKNFKVICNNREAPEGYDESPAGKEDEVPF
jgi:hypothetical protein